MTIVKHELSRGKKTFIIWCALLSFLMAICIVLFPEMKGQMEELNDTFSSMGSFTSAFGMDRLNFGTLKGYLAIECGNILGLGGAFFAALLAIGILSKEEKERTAEFLLTHPVSRIRIMTEKYVSVLIRLAAMNVIVCGITAASIAAISEEIPWKELLLLHLAFLIAECEIASICFGISAYLSRGSLGIGLGVAALLYFLNIIANITESVKFLKYATPFGYCDSADIVADGSINLVMAAIGAAIGASFVALAYFKYPKKDIH